MKWGIEDLDVALTNLLLLVYPTGTLYDFSPTSNASTPGCHEFILKKLGMRTCTGHHVREWFLVYTYTIYAGGCVRAFTRRW